MLLMLHPFVPGPTIIWSVLSSVHAGKLTLVATLLVAARAVFKLAMQAVPQVHTLSSGDNRSCMSAVPCPAPLPYIQALCEHLRLAITSDHMFASH